MEELLRLDDEKDRMTDKQIKIIEAAIEAFSEKGFAATSTSEIAQRAGVAEGTIFRHYKTKKDLLLSIVAPTMARFIAPFLLRDFSKVLDTKYARFEDFLRAIMMNRIEFVKRHADVLKIMLQEIPFHPELKEQFAEIVVSQVLVRMKAIFERFQRKGQIVNMPTVSAIRLMATAMLGFIAFRYIFLPELEWDDEQETESTVRFILHGLSGENR